MFESAADLILDGTIAQSRAQADRLWLLREAMVAAQSRSGPCHRTDVSVPLHALPPFLDVPLARLAAELPDGRPVAYGHVGDGNVHLNVVPPATWDLDRRSAPFRAADDVIFTTLDRFGGSISAEHGIGRSKKRAFLERVDPVTLDLLHALTSAIDPGELMSRGRIVDGPGTNPLP